MEPYRSPRCSLDARRHTGRGSSTNPGVRTQRRKKASLLSPMDSAFPGLLVAVALAPDVHILNYLDGLPKGGKMHPNSVDGFTVGKGS